MNAQPPQNQGPREDPVAYRIAVGALGVALVAFLVGAAVIAAGGKPVPTQFWASGSGIAGAIIGILAPNPKPAHHSAAEKTVSQPFVGIANGIRDLWNNRAVLILSAVFGVSIAFAIANSSAELETVAAAAGGALVGLLAPPPAGQRAG
jgi:hypothetical protein